MTGDVVLLNGCLASGACVDITVRDGVIHETGDTEATGGAPERDVRFAPDYVRFTPKSGHSRDPGWTSAFDPGCVKTIFWRPKRNICS